MQYSSSPPVRGSGFRSPRLFAYLVLGLLLSIGIFAGTPTPARSSSFNANPNVKITAQSLFQGNFKFGEWLPIEVSLENFGEAVDVQIQATVQTRINSAIYATTYERDVNLGERANKRLELYIVPFVETFNTSGQVSYDTPITLKVGNLKLGEARVKLQPHSPTDYLVGVFTSDPNSLSSLNNLKVGGQRNRVATLNLGLSDIPDRGAGLRSFNSIVISEQNTDSLSTDQRNALREYVETGGQLILEGGSGWNKVQSGFSSSFLPFNVTGYGNIDSLDSLVPPNGEEIKSPGPLSRPAVIAQGQVLKDARLLSQMTVGNNVVPVAAERDIGEGRVVAMSIDLAVPPLQDWSGANQFWVELFGFNITPQHSLYSEANPQVKNAADYLALVTNVPELKLPDIFSFFMIIGAYLLLVGPVNYIVLKRLRRLTFSWITLPVLTVVFTIAVINYTNTQPPGQLLVNQFTAVQVGTDQDLAQVRSFSAIFSPEDRDYDISPTLAGPDSASRILLTPLNRNSNGLNDNDPSRSMVQGEHPFLQNFQVGQWNAQGFALETTVQSQPYQVSADLHYEDGKIVGTIHNNTAFDLTNTMLVLGDAPVRFKDNIEAGEVVAVDFNLPGPTAASQAFCSTTFSSSTSFNSSNPSERIANLMIGDRKDDKLNLNRANFLRKLYDSGRYSPINNERGFDLIGWMDRNPLPISVDGVTTQSKSNQVLLARLPVNYETSEGDGRLLLPSMTFFPDSITTSNGQAALTSRADMTDQFCLNHNSVTAQYRLPLESGPFKVKSLTLYINAFGSGGNQRGFATPDSYELYDFQAKAWTDLPNIINSAQPVNTGSYFTNPPAPQKNIIANPARFADPVSGRILLRVTSNSSNTPVFVQTGLQVEGSRN